MRDKVRSDQFPAIEYFTKGIILFLIGVLAFVHGDEGGHSFGGRDTPQEALSDFMSAIASGDFDLAYSLVAPSSKINGDPIAYNEPLDYESFRNEIGDDEESSHLTSQKFSSKVTKPETVEGPGRVRIWVSFGGDHDEALVVWENGKWFVADPIHLIR